MMGSPIQKFFVEEYGYDHTVLEIGSAISVFEDTYKSHVGIDLNPARGVDCIMDICAGPNNLRKGHFTLILCCSVLEHVYAPWKAAETILDLLAPKGLLYISVPWCWKYHPYSKDYWRFSPDGIQQLFPGIKWIKAAFATRGGKFFALESLDEKTLKEKDRLARKSEEGMHITVEMVGRKE